MIMSKHGTHPTASSHSATVLCIGYDGYDNGVEDGEIVSCKRLNVRGQELQVVMWLNSHN